MQWFDSEVSGW